MFYCFPFAVFILFSLEVFCQENLLYERIQQAKADKVYFSVIPEAFRQAPNDREILDHFEKPERIESFLFDKTVYDDLSTGITMLIPLKDGQIQLDLLEVPDSFYHYEVVTSDGERRPSSQEIRHYRGIVKNDSTSIVAISFLKDEVMGIVATDKGNFNLSLDKKSGKYVFFNENNLNDKSGFDCGVDHAHDFAGFKPEVLSQPSKHSVNSEDVCTLIYIETEHDIFLNRGSTNAVETYVAGLFNQVAALYQNENVEIRLSEIFIWTNTDPYTAIDANTLLNQFQANRTSFNGDLGQLLTFRGSGNTPSGFAAGFDGLCNSTVSERLSVSMFNDHINYSVIPVFSYPVFIVAHELGHLFGSRHTQACVWNGNCTAIDGCGGTENHGCGTCPNPGIPPGGGTIMSYCALQNVGVNFNLGFGLQPGNVIRNSVANANCLCECINSTISGPDYLCSTNTFTLQNAPAGSTVSWSVSPGEHFSGDTLGSGSSATLSPYSSFASGQATITFVIETDCGEVPVHQSFWVGRPSLPDSIIWGSTSPTVGSYEMYLASGGIPPGATSMSWVLPYCFGCSDPWSIYSGHNLIQMVAIVGDSPGYVQAMGNNTCGNGPASLLYVVPDVGGGPCNPCPRIYPNPASDELFVEWRFEEEALRALYETDEYEVALYDMQGARLFSGKSSSVMFRMDLSKLRNGFYYIHILHKEGLIRKQIRVER